MKNLVIIFLAFMFTSDGLFANAIEKASPMPNLIITINIDLHSKKSNCQSGFGFCKITFSASWQTEKSGSNGGVIPGQISFDANNQLILKITEADLQKYENGGSLKYFQGKQTIYIDDNYELSQDIISSLGATKPLVIKQGEYMVKYDGTAYTLIIPQ